MAQNAAEFSGKELAEKLPETVKDTDIRTKQWVQLCTDHGGGWWWETKKVKPSRRGGSGLSEMNTGVGDNPVNRKSERTGSRDKEVESSRSEGCTT